MVLLHHVQNVSVTCQSTVQRLSSLVRHQISLDLVLQLFPVPLWAMSSRWHFSMVLGAGLACPVFTWMPRAAFQSILPVPPGSWRVRTQSSAFSPLSGKLWTSGTRYSNCVVRNNGLLTCNAYNERKQPDVPADLGPVLAAAAGRYHTCAVRTDGQLVCFGATISISVMCQRIWDQSWQLQRVIIMLVQCGQMVSSSAVEPALWRISVTCQQI